MPGWVVSDQDMDRGEPEDRSATVGVDGPGRRWVTLQVPKHGRTVNEVASNLGCDWHTVHDAVIAYGIELVDDEARIVDVQALGLDETLFCRVGWWRTQAICLHPSERAETLAVGAVA